MARETQKEKIERLERENAQLEKRIAEYHKAWAEAESQKDAAIQDTDEYKALEKAPTHINPACPILSSPK